MCYRGADSAEIRSEDGGLVNQEEQGWYGERNYNPQHQPISESEHSDTEQKNILGRVKTLFSA
jgi:hypothetical protein